LVADAAEREIVMAYVRAHVIRRRAVRGMRGINDACGDGYTMLPTGDCIANAQPQQTPIPQQVDCPAGYYLQSDGSCVPISAAGQSPVGVSCPAGQRPQTDASQPNYGRCVSGPSALSQTPSFLSGTGITWGAIGLAFGLIALAAFAKGR
jgi:hypothetical protein